MINCCDCGKPLAPEADHDCPLIGCQTCLEYCFRAFENDLCSHLDWKSRALAAEAKIQRLLPVYEAAKALKLARYGPTIKKTSHVVMNFVAAVDEALAKEHNDRG